MEMENKHRVAPTRAGCSIAIVGVVAILAIVMVVIVVVFVALTSGTSDLSALFLVVFPLYGGFIPLIIMCAMTTVVDVKHGVVFQQTFIAPLATFTVFYEV